MVVVNDLKWWVGGAGSGGGLVVAGCWMVGVWKKKRLRIKKQKTKKQIRVDRGSWCCGGAWRVGPVLCWMLGPAG
jgi:hypothetical protein